MRKQALLVLCMGILWLVNLTWGHQRMAVTIVGTDSAEISGAASITIPLAAGSASADAVFLEVVFKRAGGTNTSINTPSGYTRIVSNFSGYALFQQIYGTAPPADVNIGFGNVDVHALGRSVTVRGFQTHDTTDPYQHLTQTQTTSATSPFTLSEVATEIDGSMLLTFYGSFGAAITVPAEQASLYSATHTSPNLGLAAGHETILTADIVPPENVTLASTTTFIVVQLTIIPAGETSLFTPHWATPIGPYSFGLAAGRLLFDPNTDHAWYIGIDVSGNIMVVKIIRSTFTVATSATFTGSIRSDEGAADQDADYLYITIDGGNDSYIKVQKSDLSLVDTGDAPTNTVSPAAGVELRLSTTGWSAGYLWAVQNVTGTPHNLIQWDPATGTVVSQTAIPNTAIGGKVQYGWGALTFDSNGDIWIYSSLQEATFPDHGVLTKVTSGVTFGTPIVLNVATVGHDVYHNDGSLAEALTYDATNNALILCTASITIETGQWSQVARYNIGSGLIDWVKNYGGLVIAAEGGIDARGNKLQGFLGIPSLFTAWIDPFDSSGPTIVQYNHETGILVRTFEFQRDSTYAYPNHLVLSPEGDLWMVSGGTWATQGAGEYIHKLSISDVPGLGGGLDPYVLSYGLRWGLSMGLS